MPEGRTRPSAWALVVPLVAGLLRIPMHERPLRPWRISVGLGQEPEAAQEFTVGAGSRAENERLSSLPLGTSAWVTVVVRNGAAIAPRGSLQLLAGDRVALLAEPHDAAAHARLFRAPPAG